MMRSKWGFCVVNLCISAAWFSLTATGWCAAGEGAKTIFRFEESEGKSLALFDGEKPVLVYNFGIMLKEGVPEKFRRSSYVHPIYGLDGEVLTDDFPRDHYHHRGLFWAWVRVEADGKTYDPWAVGGLPTKFEKWLGRQTGTAAAGFGVQNGWYAGERKVVNEQVRFHVGHADDVGRAIDVDLTFEATDKPVRIGGELPLKKGYGGFGLRYAPHTKPAVMTMKDGAGSSDVIGLRSAWADYSARFNKASATAGMAILADPRNPGFPNSWLLREYGYIGPTWPGVDTFTLEPGIPLRLRYRVWVHRGDAAVGRVAQAYDRFAEQAQKR